MTWKTRIPIAVIGRRQSPINIVSRKADYDFALTANPLEVNYTPEDEVTLLNNGNSIVCQIAKPGFLTGGPLGNQQFRLEEFHLHWGADNRRGSEHTIDGKMFAAELHLVHWNTKYGSMVEAQDKRDGLAVLGVMIEPGDEHPAFSVVSNNLGWLIQPNSTGTISSYLNPRDLLPFIVKRSRFSHVTSRCISDYWTYEGSLTTPPLFESVQWIIFKEPVGFSKRQLNALRNCLIDSDNNLMQDNFRRLVPRAGRTVRASFH
ncbi:carbonic anhydrase 7-like [Dreissena polymorpha]|uniref:carbonic anhydrase 7-like n=1 Tax=Dreissena polymorpha TaxID=45954 RepID=UPI0022645D85|nr:carbonic anhydrase 7-like [Dreissena polymorpha]